MIALDMIFWAAQQIYIDVMGLADKHIDHGTQQPAFPAAAARLANDNLDNIAFLCISDNGFAHVRCTQGNCFRA